MADDTVLLIVRPKQATVLEYWHDSGWWHRYPLSAVRFDGPDKQELANAELARVQRFEPRASIKTFKLSEASYNAYQAMLDYRKASQP